MLPDVIDFDDVDFAAYEYDNDNWGNDDENTPAEPGLSLQQLQRMSMVLNAGKKKGKLCEINYVIYAIIYKEDYIYRIRFTNNRPRYPGSSWKRHRHPSCFQR